MVVSSAPSRGQSQYPSLILEGGIVISLMGLDDGNHADGHCIDSGADSERVGRCDRKRAVSRADEDAIV